MKTHKYLNVWKLSIDLVVKIYKLSSTLPKEEKYGITQQMRRSAVSIPSNIAEGAGRTSSKEFANFISISLGSLAELETQLIIAQKLSFFNSTSFDNIISDLIQIRKMLLSLKKLIKK